MDLVRHFSFEHGLLGDGAQSPDAVGIAFPNGEILGDPKNVKLRFSTQYMSEAAGTN
jgi:NitT/TauT family transport system substrate-binding protein